MKTSNGKFPIRYDATRLTEEDIFLFNEGTHFQLYEKLGAHPDVVDGERACSSIYASGQL